MSLFSFVFGLTPEVGRYVPISMSYKH